MPYIDQSRRAMFPDIELEGMKPCNATELYEKLRSVCDTYLKNSHKDKLNVGDLNYCLSMVCKGYISKFGVIRYKRVDEIIQAFVLLQNKINTNAIYKDIIGTVECCKLEFYAKVARPYEELKEAESGKVY